MRKHFGSQRDITVRPSPKTTIGSPRKHLTSKSFKRLEQLLGAKVNHWRTVHLGDDVILSYETVRPIKRVTVVIRNDTGIVKEVAEHMLERTRERYKITLLTGTAIQVCPKGGNVIAYVADYELDGKTGQLTFYKDGSMGLKVRWSNPTT